MALTFVGSAEAENAGGGDVTVTLPGGIATDDVVYVAAGQGSQADLDVVMNTSGYTELADLYYNASGEDSNLGVFRKIMGATPDSSYTIAGTGDATNEANSMCHVWSGADTSTPEDVTPTTATGDGSVSAPDGPAITPVTSNTIVLTLVNQSNFDSTVTAPTGYGNQIDEATGGGDESTTGIASIAVGTPAEEDPGVWDMTISANEGWCAVTVAIRPATGGAAVAYVMFPPRMDGLGRGGIFPGNRVQ